MQKKLLYIVAIFLTIISIACDKTSVLTFAETEFIKLYGSASNDQFSNACESKSGTILFTGAISTLKNSLQTYIVESDYFGNIINEFILGDTLSQIPKFICQTENSEYIVIGNVLKPENDKQNIYFLKLRNDGTILIDTVYLSNYNEICNSAIILANGNIIIAGYTTKPNSAYNNLEGTEDFLFRIINSEGEIVSEKIYGGAYLDVINEIDLKDDFLYAVGTTASFSSNNEAQQNAILLKMNLNAELIDMETYGNQYNNSGDAMEILNDGSILLVYTSLVNASQNFSEINIIRTVPNSIHRIIWNNVIASGTNVIALDMAQNYENIFICGISDKKGESFKDATLYITNWEGALIKDMYWGNTGEESAEQVLFTNNGLYLFGNTKVGNNSMIQIIKPKL